MNCSCPDPTLCQRLRRHVAGRDYEWWTGECPPERPCPDDQRQRVKEAWEAAALTLPTLEEQRRLYQQVYDASGGRYTALAVLPKKRPLRKPWRVVTFLGALWRHVRHGLPTATPADRAARQAICDQCEWQDKVKRVCVQCGCGLKPGQLLDKLHWAGEKCPLYGHPSWPGRGWGPVQGEKVWTRAWRWLRAIGSGAVSRVFPNLGRLGVGRDRKKNMTFLDKQP